MRNCAPKRGVREIPHLNNSIQAIEDKTPSGQPIVGRKKVCQLVSSWNHQARKKNSFSYPRGTPTVEGKLGMSFPFLPFWHVVSTVNAGKKRRDTTSP